MSVAHFPILHRQYGSQRTESETKGEREKPIFTRSIQALPINLKIHKLRISLRLQKNHGKCYERKKNDWKKSTVNAISQLFYGHEKENKSREETILSKLNIVSTETGNYCCEKIVLFATTKSIQSSSMANEAKCDHDKFSMMRTA